MCLSVYLSFNQSVYPSIHLSISLSVYLTIYLSLYVSIYLSSYRSINLSLSLSLSTFRGMNYKSDRQLSPLPVTIQEGESRRERQIRKVSLWPVGPKHEGKHVC